MLYQAPAAIITTARAINEMLVRQVRVPWKRLFAIPTGISLEAFAPRAADLDLRRRLDIPEKAPIIGTVAVLRSWKGHLYLLEAIQELIQQGCPAFLVLVGDGPSRPVIEKKIAKLGLQKWVRLAGYQDDVAPWLALLDVVVLASYANEGVPQALVQAMAMARPVVGTDTGGIPEVVIPGETGLLVAPRNPSALAKAIRRLLEDPELGRQLGRQARERVTATFSLQQMAAAVEGLYDLIYRERNTGI
jgi:glycosyltransferase involved in cell wall biosynthesis